MNLRIEATSASGQSDQAIKIDIPNANSKLFANPGPAQDMQLNSFATVEVDAANPKLDLNFEMSGDESSFNINNIY